MQDSLELDGLANSHAVRIPVEDPNRIGEIFDAISYKKVRVRRRKQRAWIISDKYDNDASKQVTDVNTFTWQQTRPAGLNWHTAAKRNIYIVNSTDLSSDIKVTRFTGFVQYFHAIICIFKCLIKVKIVKQMRLMFELFYIVRVLQFY